MSEIFQRNPAIQEFLEKHSRQIVIIEEILLFKRPFVLGVLLIAIWSLFGYAHSVNAGFFASVSLFAAVIYLICVIDSHFHEFVMQKIFPELPAQEDQSSNRVRSFEELRDFLDMLIQKTFPIVRIITFQEPKPLLLALIAFSISVLFIFIKPFWFNIVFVTLALTLPGVLLLPPVNGALFAGAEKVKTE